MILFPSTIPPGVSIFDNWKVHYAFARGSDCIVYLVERDKKIKVIKECYSNLKQEGNVKPESSRDDYGTVTVPEGIKERFMYGAQIFKKIGNPVLMNIDDIVEKNGTVYVLGEYIEGPVFADYKGRKNFDWYGKIFSCLQEIHNQGYILKGPSSRDMIIERGEPRLVDFSSVRRIGGDFIPNKDIVKLNRLLHPGYCPFPSTLPQGYRVNNYKIGRVIADGSDTLVYKIQDDYVLKEFYPHPKNYDMIPLVYRDQYGTIHSNNQVVFDEKLKRFEIGADIFKRLNHSLLMSINDVFSAHGTSYVVGEYIDGYPLFEYEYEIKPTLKQWQSLFQQILDCVICFHRIGYIQGDISSTNILVDKNNGSVKIVDFGSVKKIREDICPTDDFRKLARLISKFTDLDKSTLEEHPEDFINRFLSL